MTLHSVSDIDARRFGQIKELCTLKVERVRGREISKKQCGKCKYLGKERKLKYLGKEEDQQKVSAEASKATDNE